jgi:site-specific DNA-cytosine methylase
MKKQVPRMFTIEQVNNLHDHFGQAETLAEYLRQLEAIGVERFDSYLTDGHSEFFGSGHKVTK